MYFIRLDFDVFMEDRPLVSLDFYRIHFVIRSTLDELNFWTKFISVLSFYLIINVFETNTSVAILFSKCKQINTKTIILKIKVVSYFTHLFVNKTC